MKRLLLVSTVLYIALASSSSSSLALEVLSDNLTNTRNGGQSINNSSWAAQAFTTTSTGFVLDSVTLNMSRDNGATGTLELIIYDSSGTAGSPGNTASSVFATINVATQLSGDVGNITLSSLSVNLDPTTTYYLVLRGNGITGGDALWSFTNNTAGTGFPSNYSESNNTGVTWDAPVLSSPQKMSITAVPEPSTFVFAALGGLTIYLVRRKRVA